MPFHTDTYKTVPALNLYLTSDLSIALLTLTSATL